ncbi:MAG: nucleotidyltransferase domain-containing protein [Candidatus Latescibacteria bacterium]|jgi:predicted nucleotidyltransferase|nr:nucleotidyltransferase domain-containing protein [Candidatus Latescibacterota bacterium]
MTDPTNRKTSADFDAVVTPELIDFVVEMIVENFQPDRIVLFGSHARSECTPDSDVDLFVEMETDKPPTLRSIEISDLFGLRR